MSASITLDDEAAVTWLDGDGDLAVLCDTTHAPVLTDIIAMHGGQRLDSLYAELITAMTANVIYRPATPTTVNVAGGQRRELAAAVRAAWRALPDSRPVIARVCGRLRDHTAMA